MLKVSAEPSGSDPVKVIATGVSSGVVTIWAFAVATSFTAVTVVSAVQDIWRVPSVTV